MPRCGLVAVLVFAVLLNGCAHHQPNIVRSQAPSDGTITDDNSAEVLRKYSWSEDWIENYPVLNGTLVVVGLVAVVVAVGAFYAGYLWLAGHAHD